MEVLVVEDDDSIAEPLVKGLVREGFTVTRAATGREALDAASADLILLDLGLPDLDGNEVCRQLRSRSQTPIIVVSARDDEIDRVLLLELGADDYVVKPFGFRELVARIRAVSRRSQVPATSAPGSDPSDDERQTIHVGGLSIDRRTRQATVDGDEVALTPKEFELLSFLAEDPGSVCSRTEILEAVWDEHWWGSSKTLDVHIAALRKKLGDPRWIQTYRGVGFRLDVPKSSVDS